MPHSLNRKNIRTLWSLAFSASMATVHVLFSVETGPRHLSQLVDSWKACRAHLAWIEANKYHRGHFMIF